jgi:hypothetical protein
MRHVAQDPAHYEVELRQVDNRDERAGTAWRPVRRVEPDGAMRPLMFASLGAAQAYAKRMNPGQARIVAVEHGGWRRTVDADET